MSHSKAVARSARAAHSRDTVNMPREAEARSSSLPNSLHMYHGLGREYVPTEWGLQLTEWAQVAISEVQTGWESMRRAGHACMHANESILKHLVPPAVPFCVREKTLVPERDRGRPWKTP